MGTIKQLGYCNAYVDARPVNGISMSYTLVSYCTEVARVIVTARTVFRVELGRAAHCSLSTSKQVARFLREYAPGFEFVAHEQTRMQQGYDYYDEIAYNNLIDIFEFGCNGFTNKPDRIPYKDFYNGTGYLVKGMHRG